MPAAPHGRCHTKHFEVHHDACIANQWGVELCSVKPLVWHVPAMPSKVCEGARSPSHHDPRGAHGAQVSM